MDIEIPVKGYVKNYLEHQYGSPAHVHDASFVGKFLFGLLGDDNHHQDTKFSRYSTKVVVRVSHDVFLRNGVAMTKTNIIKFNAFMSEVIKENLYHYLLGRSVDDSRVLKKAINEYREMYSISEDAWTDEAIIKDVQRNYKISGNGVCPSLVVNNQKLKKKW